MASIGAQLHSQLAIHTFHNVQGNSSVIDLVFTSTAANHLYEACLTSHDPDFDHESNHFPILHRITLTLPQITTTPRINWKATGYNNPTHSQLGGAPTVWHLDQRSHPAAHLNHPDSNQKAHHWTSHCTLLQTLVEPRTKYTLQASSTHTTGIETLTTWGRSTKLDHSPPNISKTTHNSKMQPLAQLSCQHQRHHPIHSSQARHKNTNPLPHTSHQNPERSHGKHPPRPGHGISQHLFCATYMTWSLRHQRLTNIQSTPLLKNHHHQIRSGHPAHVPQQGTWARQHTSLSTTENMAFHPLTPPRHLHCLHLHWILSHTLAHSHLLDSP